MTPKETKAYRAELVRIVRNAGSMSPIADIDEIPWLEKRVKSLGLVAPVIVAAHLMRLIKKRGAAWERYNNAGGKIPIEVMEDQCDTIQAAVDGVLALFGITADWGSGIVPFYYVNGRQDHLLLRAIRESFEGKATR